MRRRPDWSSDTSAMVATSVGITAQVLSSKGVLDALASKVILAAAVIDDVLGLLVLAVVSSMSRGQVQIFDLALTAVLALGFTAVVAHWGTRAVASVAPKIENLRVGEAQFVARDAMAGERGGDGGWQPVPRRLHVDRAALRGRRRPERSLRARRHRKAEERPAR